MSNIQIYQLNPRISIAGTDVFAVDDNTGSHVTWKVTINQLVSYVMAAGAPILQQRWVNAAVGSDSTGTGDISNPWATYAHAVSVAAPLATITNQYVLKMIGNFSEALVLYPFVHIDQENSGLFTITGNLSTDSSFNTTVSALCNISNAILDSSSAIDIILSTANNQIINFINTIFGGIPNLSFEGASGAEVLSIQNARPSGSQFLSGVEVVNATLVLDNALVSGDADTSPTSTFNSSLLIKNSSIGGTTFADSTGASGGNAILKIQTTKLNGWQLSGTASLVTIDSVSYNSIPAFVASAAISQVTITGLTDGVLQTSYTPINYSGRGSSNYSANSLTGQLAGIDAVLNGLPSNSYAVLGYSLNSNGTTIASTSTYVPITLNTPTTSANTADFSVDGTTGEITYNGPVPALLRISCMTTGVAAMPAQACDIAPATDIGSGYVVYTYLALSQVMDQDTPLSVTHSAIVPVVVSGAKFQMYVENNTATNYFLAKTMYFSVETL